jgi:hypothetical protein
MGTNSTLLKRLSKLEELIRFQHRRTFVGPYTVSHDREIQARSDADLDKLKEQLGVTDRLSASQAGARHVSLSHWSLGLRTDDDLACAYGSALAAQLVSKEETLALQDTGLLCSKTNRHGVNRSGTGEAKLGGRAVRVHSLSQVRCGRSLSRNLPLVVNVCGRGRASRFDSHRRFTAIVPASAPR